MVLQTLAHRCGKTKIDLNLYRVKKITWEATGTFGEGRSLYRAPRALLTELLPPCRALGNDSSSCIYISLFSALIISSDYLEATVHHPFASQKLPHTIAPTCPRPQPASFPSMGLNPEAALENPFFSLLLGSFPSSLLLQLFLSALSPSLGIILPPAHGEGPSPPHNTLQCFSHNKPSLLSKISLLPGTFSLLKHFLIWHQFPNGFAPPQAAVSHPKMRMKQCSSSWAGASHKS